MKERLNLLIVLAVLSISLPAQGQPWLGSGTEGDPYLIEDANDMQAIGADPNYWDAHFKLVNDINLAQFTGTQFNIIGNDSNAFTGVFDGNGHSISNFTYTSTDVNDVGLFGCIRDGEIKDIGLINVNIDANNGDNVGGLVGYSSGTISSSYVNGYIKGNNNVGGLVGSSQGGVIGWYKVPGCGSVGGRPLDLPIIINNIISDCYTTTSIEGNSSVGGLVGYCWKSTITNCYVSGVIDGNEYKGGLVGYDVNSVYTKCFWNSEINSDFNGIGNTIDTNVIGKTTAELQTEETFIGAGWDFVSDSNKPSNIWAMPNGGGYPILWWQLSELPELPSFSGGSGSPNEPYLISTNEELNRIGHNPRLMNSCFQLINDIDLSGTDFFIIGSRGYPYRGVFDGDGYIIHNFSWTSDKINNIGLFGCICNAGQVKNLSLGNVNINAGTGNYVGGIAGFNYKGIISNCYVTGDISGGSFVGLLLGSNKSSESIAQDSYVIGRVSGNYVGGSVGYNDGGMIYNCNTAADVNGNSDVGGLAGYSLEGTIKNCYTDHNSIGDIRIGGLVGFTISTIIEDSYAIGDTFGNVSVGGFIGSSACSDISNCFSITDTIGNSEVGGLIGCGSGCTIENCYSSGDVWGSITYIGGLIGLSYADQVFNCYSCGAVDGNEYTGALVGALTYGRGGSPSYYKCFWDNTVNSGLYGCGHHPGYPPIIDPNIIGKSTQEMKEKDTYLNAGWDFVEIWDIGENQTYPFLRQYPAGDLNHDGHVNLSDFAIFADHWLAGVE